MCCQSRSELSKCAAVTFEPAVMAISLHSWSTVAWLVCVYGLVRELRPSEPYVSEFLVGEWRNITQEQVNQDVYPVGTYSYLALLVVVFLITDYLKYKPLIVLSGLCGIAVYCILLWTTSLEWLQVSQFFYGLYMATEVAYYTYIFAKVEESKYNRVASYSRSAALVGRFLSGTIAQLLTLYNVMDYRQLNYITLSSQIFATVWALFLPSVARSVYFHKETPALNNNADQAKGLRLLWIHTKSAYSRSSIITWSLWYAASTAGFYQVQYYMQLLWIEIEPDQENKYNGFVEAILTALGAGAALLAGYRRFKNRNVFNIIPTFAAALQAVAVLAVAFASSLWISYLGYITLGVIFHFMITISSIEIAHNLAYDSCFGLIFGINTLLGLAIQSLLTFIVISDTALGLNIRWQYISYAIYYIILCLCSVISWCIYYFYYRKKNTHNICEE